MGPGGQEDVLQALDLAGAQHALLEVEGAVGVHEGVLEPGVAVGRPRVDHGLRLRTQAVDLGTLASFLQCASKKFPVEVLAEVFSRTLDYPMANSNGREQK